LINTDALTKTLGQIDCFDCRCPLRLVIGTATCGSFFQVASQIPLKAASLMRAKAQYKPTDRSF
jgi:hypothetical protein